MTQLIAIFRNEVLLNTRRVAPYALMLLFIVNAILWWGWGPAVALGWATNSDYYITRNLTGFSIILGLPIFNAVIMGDPVIRDFSLGLDPLLFSKPISRAQYLLGKFFGSFFVLVCCMLTFPLTLLVLQAFRTQHMIVQPVSFIPYFKHFFFFVVISHLTLACLYFTVGTLTRNAKVVYALAVCFYPVYIVYQLVLLKQLPERLQVLFDPFKLNSGLQGGGFYHTAAYLNSYVVEYRPDMIANRLVMLLFVSAVLTILYFRFSIVERNSNTKEFAALNLSQSGERIYYSVVSLAERELKPITAPAVPIPSVAKFNEGVRPSFDKLVAALGIEFRLLRDERSLIVLAPLAVALSTFELAFYRVNPGVSYSATYASSTAQTLLLFLLGMIVFYTGEAMHRDRELRLEPVVWSTPASNAVLLGSKFISIVTLSFSLIVLVGITAVFIQLLRGHTPLQIQAFLITYSLILLPNTIFLSACSVGLNVFLRSKYVVYVVSIGMAAGLFYVYNLGHNHWLYNPLLYKLWKYGDLIGGPNLPTVLLHRIYIMATALAVLALTCLLFERKSARGLTIEGRLSGKGWATLSAGISLAIVVISGLVLIRQAR